MENKDPLGLVLARLRLGKNLSLRQVQNHVSVHYTRIGEWERGNRLTGKPVRPSREDLISLAKLYGVASGPLLAMAGYRSEEDPTPEEERLLAAFRLLAVEDRAAMLAELEVRTHRE